jgi:signal transduction histidine kinase
MFFRATEKKEGDGLGLYIVKEMLERLHATVVVTSKLNEGTDFTLTIQNEVEKEIL